VPFRSRAQAGLLWATKPKVARKLAHDAGMRHAHTTARSKKALKAYRALPYHVKPKAAKTARRHTAAGKS
jgi:hypothetical protein